MTSLIILCVTNIEMLQLVYGCNSGVKIYIFEASKSFNDRIIDEESMSSTPLYLNYILYDDFTGIKIFIWSKNAILVSKYTFLKANE